MIFVVDIDGTIADLTHREFLVADKPHPDWDSFFSDELIYKDQVIQNALDGYQAFYDLATKVYLLSGRPERSLRRTIAWMIDNGFDIAKTIGHTLFRPDDLQLPSHEFKEALLKSVILPENEPDEFYVFIDDEPRNLEMFSEYGLALKAPEVWDIIGAH